MAPKRERQMMYEVFNNTTRAKTLAIYEAHKHNFTFIHSVLTGIQNGRIFADDPYEPKSVLVMHDFGWSQFFGLENESFLSAAESFIFEKENFSCSKVRLFCPEPFWAREFEKMAELSERCQFRLKNISKRQKFALNSDIISIMPSNERSIDGIFKLDFFTRNWPSRSAFSSNSFGVFLERDGLKKAVCYSCAAANEVAEIDIYTLENERKKGYGLAVASRFIDIALEREKIPSWDCFTNNAGSMSLAQALGFERHNKPYKFFTYNRKNT